MPEALKHLFVGLAVGGEWKHIFNYFPTDAKKNQFLRSLDWQQRSVSMLRNLNLPTPFGLLAFKNMYNTFKHTNITKCIIKQFL